MMIPFKAFKEKTLLKFIIQVLFYDENEFRPDTRKGGKKELEKPTDSFFLYWFRSLLGPGLMVIFLYRE